MQNKQIIFKDEQHKQFYNEKVFLISKEGKLVDCYTKPVLYLLSLSGDTRRNFNNLFDLDNGSIKVEGMKEDG